MTFSTKVERRDRAYDARVRVATCGRVDVVVVFVWVDAVLLELVVVDGATLACACAGAVEAAAGAFCRTRPKIEAAAATDATSVMTLAPAFFFN